MKTHYLVVLPGIWTGDGTVSSGRSYQKICTVPSLINKTQLHVLEEVSHLFREQSLYKHSDDLQLPNCCCPGYQGSLNNDYAIARNCPVQRVAGPHVLGPGFSLV
jgi:hypothetical protein